MELSINKLTNEQIDILICESTWKKNSLSINIPYSFMSTLVNLNWNDILFAIDNGFLGNQSVIEYAQTELEKNAVCPQEVLELACINPNEAAFSHLIFPYINNLANQESENKKREVKDKMMYVLLRWVFENKERYSDPLKVVEIVYSDFDFPEILSGFVRYLPMKGKDLGSVELNTERLYNRWEDYLRKQSMYWKSEE